MLEDATHIIQALRVVKKGRLTEPLGYTAEETEGEWLGRSHDSLGHWMLQCLLVPLESL